MKLIIAGSRTLRVPVQFIVSILTMNGITKNDITEIVSGKEPDGIDSCGEEFAKQYGIPIKPFPADWHRYDPVEVWRQAGPVRNAEMARYADACLLIWDGNSRGSYSMRQEAEKNDLLLIEIQIKPVRKRKLKEVKNVSERRVIGDNLAQLPDQQSL